MPTPAASIWKLSSVDIYVNKDDPGVEPFIGKINPINSTTPTLHFFASERIRKVRGRFYTEANRATLEGYVEGFTTVTLTSDKGSQGSFKMATWSCSRLQALNYSDTWYEFETVLVKQ